MFAEFGSAPISLELDFDTFEGPLHWVSRFRGGWGWLIVAEATIQSEYDMLTSRLVAACDEDHSPIPAFQALNLTQCDWLAPGECYDERPEILDDLLCEEEGALIRRWHRERNIALADGFEEQEARVSALEHRTLAVTKQNERRIGELRQRRRHPSATPEIRSQLAAIARELENENDELIAEMAETRTVIREQAEAAEEALWLRGDILVEVELLHVVRWQCGGARRGDRANYSPPLQPVTYYHGGDLDRAYRSLFPDSLARYQVRTAVPFCEKPNAAERTPAQPSHWTNERTALLSSMWREGVAAAKIGERLGDVSRNAVINKAKRLGLMAKPPVSVTSGQDKTSSNAKTPSQARPKIVSFPNPESGLIKNLQLRREKLQKESVRLEYLLGKMNQQTARFRRISGKHKLLEREIAKLDQRITDLWAARKRPA